MLGKPGGAITQARIGQSGLEQSSERRRGELACFDRAAAHAALCEYSCPKELIAQMRDDDGWNA